ncbi:hypothetical protein J4E91_009992 [Alternaria rosae]|nr:hypothetical protein J4E91_009992 [Alternaria rosae]
MSFPIHVIANINPAMKDSSTQTEPNPRPTSESWDEFNIRLGFLSSTMTTVHFEDEAAKYDTSVTVAEDYAAHLKAQKEKLRERAARARGKAEKEKEEKDKEILAAEAEEIEMKSRDTQERVGEEGGEDAEGESKGSDTLAEDEGNTKLVHFPSHITIPAYILMPDFSNFALVISNMFDGLAVALLNQFQGIRIQQRDKTISKLQADNDRLRQQAVITDIQVDLLKRIATSRQNPRQRRIRSRNPRRAIAASAM